MLNSMTIVEGGNCERNEAVSSMQSRLASQGDERSSKGDKETILHGDAYHNITTFLDLMETIRSLL